MTAISPPLSHDLSHDDAHEHVELSFVKKYIFSTDHKIIGLQFLFLGLMFFVIGGLLALVVRWQLGWPNQNLPGWRAVPILGSYLWGKVDPATGQVVPGQMPTDFYTMAFTMHATIMIFFVIIPILVGSFGNFLIPLQIGARDMAFPFLNGAAFWLALPAGAIILASFFLPGGASISGWTVYPPLSEIMLNKGLIDWAAPATRFDQILMFLRYGATAPHFDAATNSMVITAGTWPAIPLVMTYLALVLCFLFLCAYQVKLGFRPLNWLVSLVVSIVLAIPAIKVVQFLAFDGQSAWFLSIFLLGFSSILGAVNYMTTIVKLRAPGMTMFRMPLTVWAMFITSILVLLATPVLASTLAMNLLDHHRFTNFFLPFNWTLSGQTQTNPGGGYPLLHQHLFWFYSHPAVYIMILPAMGMVSDILAVFARKPVFGYRPMVYALAGIAFLGFIVWAHHMFQSGMNPTLATSFAISTMFIAVPSAIKVFNWLGTLWGGNIRFTTPMLNAISFVAMFVIGGLSGIFMASPAADVPIHDTYFIVAHIHYVLFGGSMFGLFAGITFWYPKMFGRMMSEKLGKLHWILTFIFFNGTFFLMHMLGLGGMPRRVADYTNYPTFQQYLGLNWVITLCALALGVSQIIFVINFMGSWIWGKRAGRNPWQSATLEWTTPSPAPHGNWGEKLPVVHHGPYEYSSPLTEEDYLPQTRWLESGSAPGGH